MVPFKEYSKLVINQIFDILKKTYDGKHSWELIKKKKKYYPVLMDSFEKWLAHYCFTDIVSEELMDISLDCENEKIYRNLENEKIYIQAILDFIAGMTDRFAIRVFNELLNYY